MGTRREMGLRFIQDSFSLNKSSHICVCTMHVKIIERSIVNRFVHVPTLPSVVRTVSILICSRNGADLAGQSVYSMWVNGRGHFFLFLLTPPLPLQCPQFYIGWVDVGWQRHCKTCRSLRELDNQRTFFFFSAVVHS